MPPDPAQAASVSEPKLLALATAGANWRCRFCGSDARNRDGSCAQCGAGRGEAERRPAGRRVVARRVARGWPPAALLLAAAVAVGAAVVMGALVFVLAMRRPRPSPAAVAPAYREVLARVERASWEHAVKVERWQVVEREGFAEQKPASAFEVRALGERQHHVDKVPDGTTTETYTDHEPQLVSETYTDREQCGQDCTPRPQTCRETCTNNQNGFATCRTECSGGGQDCRPRYCDVTKTRMVHKTRPVQKTRTVPRYKDVPRMAAWYSWKVWDWATARELEARGEGFDTRWPSADEIALGKDLAQGERERERRRASYSVELVGEDGTRFRVMPRSLDEYTRWQGARGTLRVGSYGDVQLLAGPFGAQGAGADAAGKP